MTDVNSPAGPAAATTVKAGGEATAAGLKSGSPAAPGLRVKSRARQPRDLQTSDIRSRDLLLFASQPPACQPVSEAGLVEMVELLFFAYRDFTAEPDAVLGELGFGRAHHRVLHFVNRNPGLRVADLLVVLKITKQSLARVLKQLVGEGYVHQAAGENDRRERRLHLTEKGRELALRLLALQTRRIAGASAAAGGDAGRIARDFLFAVIAEADRAEVERLLKARRTAGDNIDGENR